MAEWPVALVRPGRGESLARGARGGWLAAFGALAIALAACSSSGAPSPGAATAPPSQSTATQAPAGTPTGTGPATATLTFVGDSHLAAGVTPPVVQCNFPSPTGRIINVVVGSSDGVESVFLAVSTAGLYVRVSIGPGPTAPARTFNGTAVTGFDPARGATLGGAVNDTTPAGQATGAVPVLQSVTGTIACGGQTAGSGTVHMTGTLPEGAVDGDLDQLRAVCNTTAGATTVAVTGIVNVGGTPTLAAASILPTGSVALYFETKPAPRVLSAAATTSGTTTSTSGTLNADAVSAPDSSIHVSGAVTCGASS